MKNNIDFKKKVLNEMLKRHKMLDSTIKSRLKKVMATTLYSNELFQKLKGSKDLEKDFITEEILIKAVEEINDSDVETKSINEKISSVIYFKNHLSDKLLLRMLEIMTLLQNNENSKQFREQKINLLSEFDKVITSCFDNSINLKETKPINLFADSIIAGLSKTTDIEQKKSFIYIAYMVSNLTEDPKKQNLNEYINAFIQQANLNQLKDFLDKLNNVDFMLELLFDRRAIFLTRIIQDNNIRQYLLPIANEETQVYWLTNLLTKNISYAITEIPKLTFKKENEEKLINQMLSIAPTQQLPLREQIMLAIGNMKDLANSEYKDNFKTQINNHLNNNDPNTQNAGYNILKNSRKLNTDDKRDIVNSTNTWLVTLEGDQVVQNKAILAVTENSQILKSDQIEKFITFIFGKLIQTNIAMDFGFSALSQIKPKITYKSFEKHFNNIITLYIESTDKNYKNQIYNGLITLYKLTELKTVETSLAFRKLKGIMDLAEKNGWDNQIHNNFTSILRHIIKDMTKKYGINKPQLKKTRGILNKAIKIDNSKPDFYHLKGLSYFYGEYYSLAIPCYEKAIALKSDNVWSWTDEIICLYRTKKVKEAKIKYDEAIAKGINSQNLLNELQHYNIDIKKISANRTEYVDPLNQKTFLKELEYNKSQGIISDYREVKDGKIEITKNDGVKIVGDYATIRAIIENEK